MLESALGRTVAPRSLGVMVERLSARYRGENVVLAPADELAARALFWLPRDLPKVQRAVSELAFAGALPDRPLKVLDLGAGLGATSLGLLRALPAGRAVAEITAVDRDARALEVFQRVFARAQSAGLAPAGVTAQTLTRDLSADGWDESLGTYDVILAGLSLVELAQATAESESARGAVIAERVRAILPHLAEDGALILVEPGSRHETRALHHARDALLSAGVTVFSPCLHARACPMLTNERDWCHEDLPELSLPPWLVPIAKLAGLRWDGPTWSYLVLRRDGRTLRDAIAAEGRTSLRMVSNLMATKGKIETLVCGELPGDATLRRAMELEREAKKAKSPTFDTLARGDVITVPTADLEGDAGKVLRRSPGQWERVEG